MIIKNNLLTVEISSFGAELKSIIKDDIEYLWQGDPKYWKRSSPVLFPIVGRLLDDEYIYNNKTYKLTQHGFARDCEFMLVKKTNKEGIYLLKENNEILKKYPFKFNLSIGYKLVGNKIVVSWTVENTNTFPMYFQIGGHPAFNFLNNAIIEINKKTNFYELRDSPYIKNIIKDYEVGSISIDNETFINNALIYDNIDQVTLKDNRKAVTIECNNFPYLGIWTNIVNNMNAPFICLEPWHGIADFDNHNKNLIDKVGIKYSIKI